MAETEQPQIYLITPPEFELSSFPETLGRVIDVHDIACVRLALATADESRVARAADALREITHARDVALVIESHVMQVERLGLDGVHLTDGARSVRATRKELGAEAVVGAFCGVSNHEGMTAAESGADYVAFGPAGTTPLGDGTRAEADLFQWWTEMIEVPVVAEGALDLDLVRKLAPHTDFFGFGEEIWRCDDPAATLGDYINAMS
jgi:thiamine-phosphate pyrophosphorylase